MPWEEFGQWLRRVQRLGFSNLALRVHIACLYVQSLHLFPRRAREAWDMLLEDAERTVTLRDCSQRLRPFLAEVLARHAGERIVLVSHRMLLDHLLRLLLGMEETAPRCTFDTDNGGVHRLLHWKGCGRVLELNGTAHLR
ncbi:hypothetical protein DAT35_53970 [Vitiosangium sp. GDMCC 1.1324]|nr:hypothetical protein DAT35_53970 [Vitiosangium sp. GDMCC 1.1324]